MTMFYAVIIITLVLLSHTTSGTPATPPTMAEKCVNPNITGLHPLRNYRQTPCEVVLQLGVNATQTGVCLNGGTCRLDSGVEGLGQQLSAYHCECAVNFVGRNCEVNITSKEQQDHAYVCAGVPCLEGGTCYAQKIKLSDDTIEWQYTCDCKMGRTGARCETFAAADECNAQWCNGRADIRQQHWLNVWHGQCPPSLGTQALPCNCRSPWAKPDCATKVPSEGCLSSEPSAWCRNAAACDYGNCSCANAVTHHDAVFAFKGTHCEQSIELGEYGCEPCAPILSEGCRRHWADARQLRVQAPQHATRVPLANYWLNGDWKNNSDYLYRNPCLKNGESCRAYFATLRPRTEAFADGSWAEWDERYSKTGSGETAVFAETVPIERNDGDDSTRTLQDTYNLLRVSECTCPPDRKGMDCGEPKADACDWDERQLQHDGLPCQPRRQLNGSGECRSRKGSFKAFDCICPPEYTGARCGEDNPCVSANCTGDDTCVRLPAFFRRSLQVQDDRQEQLYVCACAQDEADYVDAYDADPDAAAAAADVCGGSYSACNGSLCASLGNGVCLPCGLFNQHLGTNASEALLCPDQRPRDKERGYRCECDNLNWHGDDCELRRDPCTDVLCEYDGLCRFHVPTWSKARCECAPGLGGARCQLVTDRCLAPGPPYCHNDGTCITFANGSSLCQCAEGFIGIRCQLQRDADGIFVTYYNIIGASVAFAITVPVLAVHLRYTQRKRRALAQQAALRQHDIDDAARNRQRPNAAAAPVLANDNTDIV